MSRERASDGDSLLAGLPRTLPPGGVRPAPREAPGHRPDDDRTVATITAPLVEGRYTVVLPDGRHRTLRLELAPPDFRAGRMLIAFLAGPDVDTDYVRFGHVTLVGTVRVWARYRPDSQLAEAVRVLVQDPRAAARAYALRSLRCFRCHKPLTRPDSIARAMGSRCARVFDGRPASVNFADDNWDPSRRHE